MAQIVKCLPVMWETQVQSLGREDPLEKETATHSSVLAWRTHFALLCFALLLIIVTLIGNMLSVAGERNIFSILL